ncbi:MAG: tetratricopeptide repeat-containing serine protease family protein [Verrucomicrobiota bacterium]
MNRFSIIRNLLLLAALCLLAAEPAQAKEDWSALIKRVQPAVVTVLTYNPWKAEPVLSTAFFISSNRLMTARHVFREAERAEIHTFGGEYIRVTGLLAEDRPRDLCLFEVERVPTNAVALKIARTVPEVGQPIFTVGCPLGLEWTASEGIVSNLRPIPGAGVAVQHTVPISKGNSGGPIMNTNGEVVAVQTGTMAKPDSAVPIGQELNFAAPGTALLELKARPLRSLIEANRDLPKDWVAPITQGIDRAGLRMLIENQHAEALKFYEAALARDPREPDVWFRIGLCHERLNRFEPAEKAYRRALELKPEMYVAANNLAAVLNRQHKYDPAIALLERVIEHEPKMDVAWDNLLHACLKLKKYDEVVRWSESGLKANPDNKYVFYQLAQAQWRMGDKTKAEATKRKLSYLDAEMAAKVQRVFDGE